MFINKKFVQITWNFIFRLNLNWKFKNILLKLDVVIRRKEMLELFGFTNAFLSKFFAHNFK